MATTQTQETQTEAAFQEAFQTAQELERRLVLVSRQLAVVEDLLAEKRRARDTVAAWKDAAAGDEVLIPIGGETFLPAKVGATGLVVKGIGAGYAMERRPEDALEALGKEVAALEKDVAGLADSARKLEAQLQQVNAYLERLQG